MFTNELHLGEKKNALIWVREQNARTRFQICGEETVSEK